MSEDQQLQHARKLIAENKTEEASSILRRLHSSTSLTIRLNAILSLMALLNYVTENDKLLEITNEGIDISSRLGKNDVRAFLLGKKMLFLGSQLGFLIYRQRNLKLAAGVFKWVDFSLEKDKRELEAIELHRQGLEQEIWQTETTVLKQAEISTDHYLRGHIFLAMGDFYSSKYLNDHLDLMIGGKTKSMIGNIYFVRRWGLYKPILYRRVDRKKLSEDKRKCLSFFDQSIKEFELGKKDSELAHAYYQLAVTLNSMFSFRRARIFLRKARDFAQTTNEKRLLAQTVELEKHIAGKNRYNKDYVVEYGLDMP